MKRGDIVIASPPGSYGKPRPCAVVQSNYFAETDSNLLCLFTTTTRDASFYRLPLSPGPKNGLEARSDIMVDKIMALPRVKCGGVIDSLELNEMAQLEEALKLILDLS